MKITLVNPPSIHLKYEPPLGLASLGGYLVKNNIETSILDAEVLGMSHSDIREELKRQSPDFVGVSVFTYNRFSAFSIAKIAKDLGARVVTGGPHVSFTPRETLLENPYIDYIVMGEGEVSLYNLLKAHQNNTSLEEVAGIAFRGNGGVNVNGPQPLIEDINELPDPAWHLLPMEEYPYHAVMGARGCPNSCIFCASPFLWQKKLRFLSADKFIDQIKFLLKNYGKRRVHFKDDTFTCNIKRAKEICNRIIDEKLDITWDCLSRVHPLDQELLKLTIKAGCDKIRFGIEAGNEQILKQIKKNINKEQVKHAINIAKSLDFKSVGTLFMLGHPQETYKELQDTYDLAWQLRADHVTFAPAMIFPGTELYDIALKNNLLPKDFSWNKKYNYSELAVSEEDVPLFSTETLSAAKLEEYSNNFYADSFFSRIFNYSSVWDYRYLFETGLGVSFESEENKKIIIDKFKSNLAAQPRFFKKLQGFYLLGLYFFKAENIQKKYIFDFLKKIIS